MGFFDRFKKNSEVVMSINDINSSDYQPVGIPANGGKRECPNSSDGYHSLRKDDRGKTRCSNCDKKT